MQVSEFEGKNIDDAIRNACEAFGVPREKLNIEILAEGSAGFLGLGSKKARIRAALLKFDGETVMRRFDFLDDDIDEAGETVTLKEAETLTPAIQKMEKVSDVAEKAREILEGILLRMSLPSPVTVEEMEDRIILNIHSDGGGLLIGKRGKNLDALQYIVSKAANRQGESRKMIIIDTETYRKRREDSLVSLAKELGEKARRTQKPITVSHMNAHNRRIIHMALQDEEGITTKSRGEGEFRKIVILPTRK
jgi:spoIIIJ-associated protein